MVTEVDVLKQASAAYTRVLGKLFLLGPYPLLTCNSDRAGGVSALQTEFPSICFILTRRSRLTDRIEESTRISIENIAVVLQDSENPLDN